MAEFKAVIRAFWRFVLEILFPAFCMGCGSEGSFLCGGCVAKISRLERQVCAGCGCEDGNWYGSAGGILNTDGHARGMRDLSGGGGLCESCKAKPGFYLDSLVAVSEYKDKSLLARAIHAMKYEFVEDLADPLAGLFVEKLCAMDASAGVSGVTCDFVICPVPLHRKRLRWRGFNQAEMMAETARKSVKMEVKSLLERTTFSRPQMELKKEERAKNVTDAFRCTLKNPPKKVLLLDDVATTLSTLNACAKALKEDGVKSVSAIVLARVN